MTDDSPKPSTADQQAGLRNPDDTTGLTQGIEATNPPVEPGTELTNSLDSVDAPGVEIQGRLVRRLGEYDLLDELGAGGMGQVFKARQWKMKRLVALKVLSPKLVDSPAAV